MRRGKTRALTGYELQGLFNLSRGGHDEIASDPCCDGLRRLIYCCTYRKCAGAGREISNRGRCPGRPRRGFQTRYNNGRRIVLLPSRGEPPTQPSNGCPMRCARPLALLALSRLAPLRNATSSVFHQRHVGRVLRSPCNVRGRRLASSCGREPQPGRCPSFWPCDL
jgi:hypothetical protein